MGIQRELLQTHDQIIEPTSCHKLRLVCIHMGRGVYYPVMGEQFGHFVVALQPTYLKMLTFKL